MLFRLVFFCFNKKLFLNKLIEGANKKINKLILVK